MRTCRVLLCDDTPHIRTVVRTLLQVEGDLDVVAEARDGREAIDLAREYQPDVVVLDISMPNMGGMEALPIISEVAPGARVVMFSAHGTSELREQAYRLGATHFVLKGGDPRRLVSAVQDECAAE